jgi:hypothetical protein
MGHSPGPLTDNRHITTVSGPDEDDDEDEDGTPADTMAPLLADRPIIFAAAPVNPNIGAAGISSFADTIGDTRTSNKALRLGWNSFKLEHFHNWPPVSCTQNYHRIAHTIITIYSQFVTIDKAQSSSNLAPLLIWKGSSMRNTEIR